MKFYIMADAIVPNGLSLLNWPDGRARRKTAGDEVLGAAPQLPVHFSVSGEAVVNAVRQLHQPHPAQEILQKKVNKFTVHK